MSIYDFVAQYWPRLFSGTGITLAQFFLSAAVGIAISLCMGLMKLSRNPFVRAAAVTYIELFRGTSLVVQLYWIFFVLPLFGLTIKKFTAGYLAVGMNIGAYGAELVRGGILSVPKGQWEAALALNMSPFRRMRRIILPQALANMLPPWGNSLIAANRPFPVRGLFSRVPQANHPGTSWQTYCQFQGAGGGGTRSVS